MPDDFDMMQFRIDYERRHAELEQRMMRLETIVSNLVSRADLETFRSNVSQLQEAVKYFETLSDGVATKTDLQWIKGFVEKAVGVLVAILIAIIGALFAHVFGQVP